MSGSTLPISEKLVTLRNAFDGAFALPRKEPATGRTKLLAIQVRGDPYAVKISELAGLILNRKAVRMPGSVPEQMGVVGIRGKLVAIYNLGSLLGYRAERQPEPWILQCGSDRSVGLSFEDLSGYVEVGPGSLVALAWREGSKKHLNEVLHDGSVAHPVISIPSVLTAIQGLVAVTQQR